MVKRGGYGKKFLERLGIYSQDVLLKLRRNRRVWIHAVSLGEMFVALRFIEEFRAQGFPWSFVVTTTTTAGRSCAEKRLREDDVLIYLPVDFPFVVKRVFRLIQPVALLLTESEWWPNLIRVAISSNTPVITINGRISEKSLKRYRFLKPIFRRLFGGVTMFLMQSQTDAQRLIHLGAEPSKIHITGNAKYDCVRQLSEEIDTSLLLKTCGFSSTEPIIVGGSTWHGEEEILVKIYKRLKAQFPGLRLILAPRHVERTGEITEMLSRYEVTYIRRSNIDVEQRPDNMVEVLVVDTTGELIKFYACAWVIFVGRSLTVHGGQNVIEPAALGKPVITGPYTENFSDIVSEMIEDEAIIVIHDETELEDKIKQLLTDSELRKKYGRQARNSINKRGGSVQKSVKLISNILKVESFTVQR
jgi:3-deoxy-D-manno-octulosonic-acid transferase